jgi:hypothetical protein
MSKAAGTETAKIEAVARARRAIVERVSAE